VFVCVGAISGVPFGFRFRSVALVRRLSVALGGTFNTTSVTFYGHTNVCMSLSLSVCVCVLVWVCVCMGLAIHLPFLCSFGLNLAICLLFLLLQCFVLVFATCQTFLYADRAAKTTTTTATFQFYYFHLPAFVFIASSVMKTFATASACI